MNSVVRGGLGPLAALLFAALAVVAVACGDDSEVDPAADTPSPTEQLFAPSITPLPTPDCPEPTVEAPEPDMSKQYDSKPAMTIDSSKSYTALIKTERGDITLALRPDLAPEHVNSFVFLARDGYYDGVTFHRVLPGFVAQAGDPAGTGSGGPGYTLPAEFTNEVKFQRGTLGMARTNDPNSAGSQFFINYAATPNLDGQYTIFGEVTDGMDVVDCITPRDPSANPGAPPGDAVVTIEITES